MKGADVYSPFTENGADAANHARHIAIVHQKDVAVRNGFDTKAVDLSDAAFACVRITEDRSCQQLFSVVGDDARLNCRNGFTATANVRRADRNPAFFRDEKSIHYVHPSADITQEAREKRARDRRGIDVYNFAGKRQVNLAHRAANDL